MLTWGEVLFLVIPEYRIAKKKGVWKKKFFLKTLIVFSPETDSGPLLVW